MIQMDPMLIEQVVINLLENAVKHAKGMTKLELKIESKDSQVTFSVSDDGNGFLAKDKGIGLSVCTAIVQAHDGELCIEHLKPHGVRVWFSLKQEDEGDE